MGIEFLVFSVEAFQFSKFYKKEAKHDKRNFKRGLSEIHKTTGKIGLALQACFFCA